MKTTFDSVVAADSRLLVALLQLILVVSVSSAQTPLAFNPTGNLNTGRNAQRAIPLNDGTILVTGGYDFSENALASSELYNPTTGVFTTTGNLVTARRNFGITLLDDGTVLVTGGYDNNFTSLASAEIYDPATGIFTATTGNLGTARGDHTATLLSDGTVLIAGGFDNGGNPLSSAELYIPSTKTFSPTTGSLNVARVFSTATTLTDGTVLIEGGWANNSALSSAELYDSATQSFTSTGSLNVARVRNTATLLNGGAVLIVGGEDSGSNALASAELYHPILKTFTPTGSLNTARGDHGATLLINGTVLVEGGFACQPSACAQSQVDMTSSAEIYDPVSGTFAATGSLLVARQVHTATLLSNGNVLVAGGWSDANPGLTSAEVYQPATFAPQNLVSIAISPVGPSLTVGASQALIATGTFSDSTTQTLVSAIWSSLDTTVATVTNDSGSNTGMTNDSSNSGVVFGVAPGSTTVTACTGTICDSTTVTVSLSPGSGIDFGFSVTNTSATIVPGGTATYQLSVNSRGGNIGSAVNLSCSGAPAFATCNVSPSSVTPGNGSSSVTVSVTTAGPSAALIAPVKAEHSVVAWLSLSQGFGIFGALSLGNDGRRKKHAYLMVLLVLLVGILLLTGCGGAPLQPPSVSHATPPGTYHLLLAGQSASAQHVVTLTLTVR